MRQREDRRNFAKMADRPYVCFFGGNVAGDDKHRIGRRVIGLKPFADVFDVAESRSSMEPITCARRDARPGKWI